MKTQSEAISEGYDVDLSGPGRPMGARGKYPHFEVIPLLLTVSIWYLILPTIFSIVQYYVERRYARGSTRNLPPTPLQRLRKNLRLFGSFRRPEVAR